MTRMRSVISLSIYVLAAAHAGCTGDRMGDAQAALAELPEVAVTRRTEALHGYDEAPRSPDADDPAIWVHPRDPGRSLIVAALKDAGLAVYDLSGELVQAIAPAFRRPVTGDDPPVPGPAPDPGTSACPDSESGETFGRFNNVDILYGVELPGRGQRADIAVVTDRGCDRLRIYTIDRDRREPLAEITSPGAPRLFPDRFVQPSPYQPGTEPEGLHPNPLDDESTGYGLALYDPPGPRSPRAFVTQRERARVAEAILLPGRDGSLSYRVIREYRFPVLFDVGAGAPWTPCRETADDDPQLEGMVVDQERGILYASQEVVGVWRVPLAADAPAVVQVAPGRLVQRTRSFGAPYWAIPDDDEFECAMPEEGAPPAGTIAVPGNPAAGGEDLEADVEGLAIYHTAHRGGYLLVSSQGDDTYHVYDRRDPRRRLGGFQIDGTGETDGHEVMNVSLGRRFRHGLFVTQNGHAPPPESTEPINGFEYDNSTQFQLVDWKDIARPLDLEVDTTSFDPRRPFGRGP
jgi:3-phytase